MAEFGPTNETFSSAVAKAVNHLTLGVVDFRESRDVEGEGIVVEVDNTEGVEVVEKSVENSVDKPVENIVEKSEDNRSEAVFDGYVEESTEIRKEMTRNALTVWGSSAKNVAVGVGLGGAGEAMYAAGLTSSPKEIVQNQYASLLMETVGGTFAYGSVWGEPSVFRGASERTAGVFDAGDSVGDVREKADSCKVGQGNREWRLEGETEEISVVDLGAFMLVEGPSGFATLARGEV